MESDQFETIKQRSVKGVVALASRTVVLQLIAFIATFLLTVLLSPAEYGVFFLVSALINFFTYFSDIGLAAALIQKKKKITNDDLNTTFLTQQTLVISLVLLAWLSSGLVGRWYNLSSDGVWLFRALALSLLLSSLKTIPSIILERKLLFKKLVLPQVFETLAFYLIAVFMAWRGFGVLSFAYAVLVRGVLGLIIIYQLVAWRPRLKFNWRIAKRLFSFGLPFQMNSLLALIKDDLLTAFLGKILPLTAIGYIGWAQKWAYFPYRIVADNFIRITFPVYSRLQKYPEKLKAAVEKSIFAGSLVLMPIAGGLIALSQRFILVIPKYLKWQPALLPLKFFALAAVLAGISTPLINALNGVGKIKISLRFMTLWTVLTWILVPLMVFRFNYLGVAVALLLVSMSSLLVLPKTARLLNLRLGIDLFKLFLAAGLMTLVVTISNRWLPVSFNWLGLQIMIGAMVYFSLVYWLSQKRLIGLLGLFQSVFKKAEENQK